jgi:hypothetical protein
MRTCVYMGVIDAQDVLAVRVGFEVRLEPLLRVEGEGGVGVVRFGVVAHGVDSDGAPFAFLEDEAAAFPGVLGLQVTEEHFGEWDAKHPHPSPLPEGEGTYTVCTV